MQTLFDETDVLNILDIVENHLSYNAIMEDGVVTEQELKCQKDATIASFRRFRCYAARSRRVQ